MRYTVLADGQPIPEFAILPNLEIANKQGEKLAADKPDAEVCIDGYSRSAGPIPSWRFDREISDWVTNER